MAAPIASSTRQMDGPLTAVERLENHPSSSPPRRSHSSVTSHDSCSSWPVREHLLALSYTVKKLPRVGLGITLKGSASGHDGPCAGLLEVGDVLIKVDSFNLRRADLHDALALKVVKQKFCDDAYEVSVVVERDPLYQAAPAAGYQPSSSPLRPERTSQRAPLKSRLSDLIDDGFSSGGSQSSIDHFALRQAQASHQARPPPAPIEREVILVPASSRSSTQPLVASPQSDECDVFAAVDTEPACLKHRTQSPKRADRRRHQASWQDLDLEDDAVLTAGLTAVPQPAPPTSSIPARKTVSTGAHPHLTCMRCAEVQRLFSLPLCARHATDPAVMDAMEASQSVDDSRDPAQPDSDAIPSLNFQPRSLEDAPTYASMAPPAADRLRAEMPPKQVLPPPASLCPTPATLIVPDFTHNNSLGATVGANKTEQRVSPLPRSTRQSLSSDVGTTRSTPPPSFDTTKLSAWRSVDTSAESELAEIFAEEVLFDDGTTSAREDRSCRVLGTTEQGWVRPVQDDLAADLLAVLQELDVKHRDRVSRDLPLPAETADLMSLGGEANFML
ncbi:uncharacterized protein MONBRDRAFT_4945 [Monosiga brevicollis MX1]|uniref:PDZ domain-containing protein n=1 Tax=Monosiga brevicollis TaxID=81824 RepID=A9UPF2_MONBE|nr:uncharacterized protein MONBRDRAFT_4945 [Monosiga brevicollis MX1]EDQ92862.1 predicted protein [Monosiga brevicollis MX1]|eukprot:XP_001742624.1 hypothetical protein [Monosiga brevicollis MX1]